MSLRPSKGRVVKMVKKPLKFTNNGKVINPGNRTLSEAFRQQKATSATSNAKKITLKCERSKNFNVPHEITELDKGVTAAECSEGEFNNQLFLPDIIWLFEMV